MRIKKKWSWNVNLEPLELSLSQFYCDSLHSIIQSETIMRQFYGVSFLGGGVFWRHLVVENVSHLQEELAASIFRAEVLRDGLYRKQ